MVAITLVGPALRSRIGAYKNARPGVGPRGRLVRGGSEAEIDSETATAIVRIAPAAIVWPAIVAPMIVGTIAVAVIAGPEMAPAVEMTPAVTDFLGNAGSRASHVGARHGGESGRAGAGDGYVEEAG